jgi:hypothetical protein
VTRTSFIRQKQRFTSRILIAGLSLLFLFIQVCFNYDTGNSSFRLFSHSGAFSVAANGKQLSKSAAQSSVRNKQKLNRRFYPSALPGIKPIVGDQPECLVPDRGAGIYRDAPYTHPAISTHALRGPPVIA